MIQKPVGLIVLLPPPLVRGDLFYDMVYYFCLAPLVRIICVGFNRSAAHLSYTWGDVYAWVQSSDYREGLSQDSYPDNI